MDSISVVSSIKWQPSPNKIIIIPILIQTLANASEMLLNICIEFAYYIVQDSRPSSIIPLWYTPSDFILPTRYLVSMHNNACISYTSFPVSITCNSPQLFRLWATGFPQKEIPRVHTWASPPNSPAHVAVTREIQFPRSRGAFVADGTLNPAELHTIACHADRKNSHRVTLCDSRP